IMISGHSTIETAVSALNRGAVDFLEKPFKTDRLLLSVERNLENYRLKRENASLKERLLNHDEIFGESQISQRLKLLVSKVAPTNSRVLISGGYGVGKEVVARSLHKQSKRTSGPFISYNCALKRKEDIECDLFGSEAGETRHQGLLEKANKGTLFLDEISAMPLPIQKRLANVLQEQRFSPLNSTRKINFDARILSASAFDLTRLIEHGKFLEDLFIRLKLVSIRVPFLRERREEIIPMFDFFMRDVCQIYGKAPKKLSQEAISALESYHWPGNVRQLKNVVEWLVIMERHNAVESHSHISLKDLPPEISGSSPIQVNWMKGLDVMSLPLREARELFERHYLTSQIGRFSGNISQTANFVGMERSALHRKLKSLQLNDDSNNTEAI
ncbi:MAG: sigma-54 dependent transcriptional regulator, partial [Alphaproteobacteria bacterium]|nr:sigma-54 dependent transcriptional regulator [Alphaproteobacteria bacterium]